jgi:hypothetical protein
MDGYLYDKNKIERAIYLLNDIGIKGINNAGKLVEISSILSSPKHIVEQNVETKGEEKNGSRK